MADSDRDAKDLRDKVLSLQCELQQVSTERDAYSAKLRELKKQLKERDSLVAELREAVKLKDTDLARERAAAAGLKRTLDALHAEREAGDDEIRQRHEGDASRLEELREELRCRQEEEQRHLEAVHRSKLRISELECEVGESEQAAQRYESAMRELTADHSTAAEALRTEVQELRSGRERAEAQVDAAVREQAAVEAEHQTLLSEVEAMRQLQDQVHANLSAQRDAAIRGMAVAEEEAVELRRELSAENQRLRQQNESFSQENERLVGVVLDLKRAEAEHMNESNERERMRLVEAEEGTAQATKERRRESRDRDASLPWRKKKRGSEAAAYSERTDSHH